MIETANDILAAAAEEVLETMFFAGVCGPSATRPGSAALAASLSFRPHGTMVLSLSESSARALAASFLAEDDGYTLTGDQLGAVVCEMTNMICGALLSRLKSDAEFHLSPPLPLDTDRLPNALPTCSLDLEDGQLHLWLTWESHAA